MTSSRPAWKSKPIASAARRPNDFCSSTGKRRLRISVFGRRELAAISATSGTSSSRRAARTCADFGGSRAGLVVVEQRIVAYVGIAESVGFLPLELDRLFQQRLKGGEVVGRTRFGPNLLTEDGCFCELFDERLRQLGCAVVVTLQIVNDRAGIAVRILGERAAGELAEPLADFGLCLSLVDQAGEVTDLLGPVGAAGRRQLGALVPFKQLLRGGKERDFAGVCAELFVTWRGEISWLTECGAEECSADDEPL